MSFSLLRVQRYQLRTSVKFAGRMSSTNASGLTPSASKTLPERQAEKHEEHIIQAIKEMYSCKPTDATFSIYTDAAVFHDPIGYAEGRDSVKSQFVGLAKLFPRADIPKFRVLKNPPGLPSTTVLIDQDVAYFRDANGTSPTKTVNSLLTLETTSTSPASASSVRVTRHTEEWNHSKETSSEDGTLGWMNEMRKRATASLTHTVVGSKA